MLKVKVSVDVLVCVNLITLLISWGSIWVNLHFKEFEVHVILINCKWNETSDNN
jgi:hypothetical protein